MSECERIIEQGLLSESFFKEENRCGFLVSEMMKKVWAVELDLLNKFQLVCQKHGIRYYAIGGTLLGAVRHQGFIPWDDDIDIAMFREDYKKLQSIAADEFEKPYFFQDEYTDPGVLYGHAKLRNSNTTIISENFLNNPAHGICSFNQGIFIDIFPIDNIPENSSVCSHWRNILKNLAFFAWETRKFSHRHNVVNEPYMNHIVNSLRDNPNMLFRIYDDVLSVYSGYDTKKCCLYSLYCHEDRWSFDTKDFYESLDLPFENLTIPCPKNYNEILSNLYGDWKVMKKLPTLHSTINGSFFDVEHPYTDYVDSEKGINKEKVKELINNQK